jgi:hypothetical protein
MSDLIDRVIVPALLERFLREMREAKEHAAQPLSEAPEPRPCA